MTVLGRCSRNDIYILGAGVQATLHKTAAAGHRHHLIGSCRRWEGWGQAVALWSLEWWAAGGTTLSTSYGCHATL